MAVLGATQEAPAKSNEAPAAPAGVVAFVRASDEHVQPGNVDSSRLLTASAQDAGVFDLPAYGYIRWLYVLVTATGGSGTSVTAAEDGPFNVLQNIQLTEPNGAFIAQFNNGYELYLANKYGGYTHPVSGDPKLSPVHSAVAGATGNFTFLLRLPVEVSARDAVGALPNQDSAGQFKLRFGLAPSTVVYGTVPTTLPTIRVRAWLSAWDQPEPMSGGIGNETAPPAVGTTSFWSVQSGITVNAGENTIELKRKGNFLRNIIFVLRRGGTVRSTGESDWPAETRFMRDAFPARYYDNNVWKHLMYERTGYTGTADAAGGPENGVRFHDYAHDFSGALGYENRDLWQPSRGSTRLEIVGNFTTAGTLTVITNDVAIADNVFL